MTSSTPINGNTSGRINLKVEQLTYEWVIEKFKHLSEENKRFFLSPIFSTVNNEEEWMLILGLRGHTEETADGMDDYMDIALALYSHKAEKIKIRAEAGLFIPQIGIKDRLIETFERKGQIECLGSVKRSELLQSCDSNNKVTIILKIDIPREKNAESIDKTKCMEQIFDSPRGELGQDFRLLFSESKFSDFSVIVGTKKFSAHKVVLAARSPVFSAKFENEESQENLTNEVKIEKMEPAVVEAMLEYFYTDEVTNLEELACRLLEAADKFDIQRLRGMCERMLYKTLDKHNAAEILLYADRHRSQKLKEHVMEFMEDHMDHVVESGSYKGMEDCNVLQELMQNVAVRRELKE